MGNITELVFPELRLHSQTPKLKAKLSMWVLLIRFSLSAQNSNPVELIWRPLSYIIFGVINSVIFGVWVNFWCTTSLKGSRIPACIIDHQLVWCYANMPFQSRVVNNWWILSYTKRTFWILRLLYGTQTLLWKWLCIKLWSIPRLHFSRGWID